MSGFEANFQDNTGHKPEVEAEINIPKDKLAVASVVVDHTVSLLRVMEIPNSEIAKIFKAHYQFLTMAGDDEAPASVT